MKIMILYASAGGGHKRAAEALVESATAHALTPVVRDILDFVPPLYRKTYAGGYLRLIRAAPELWGYLYSHTDRRAQHPLQRNVRSVFNKLNALSFYHFFKDENPDAVVCTHFMPLELIASRRKERYRRVPLSAVVTDYAAHALWYCRGNHRYYVATEEAKRQLMRKGQSGDLIFQAGIPILSAFGSSEPAGQALKRMGLDPSIPAVLIMSGGYGVGPTLRLLQACLEKPPPCQLLIVAGKSREIEEGARRMARGAPLPVTVYGYTTTIHEMMDAATLVISKPGGLTCAEVLAKHKPLVIVEPVPGQEQRNAEYLLERGCAARLFDAEDAPYRLTELLADPEHLARMSRAAAKLARPDAADRIIRDVCAVAGAGARCGGGRV